MIKKPVTVVTVIALLVALSGAAVFGKSRSDPDNPAAGSGEASSKAPSSKSEAKRDAKLKADMLKLLSDAKAGKVAPKPQQFPNRSRNNLSTGAKIGIAAAIGGAIVLIIIYSVMNGDKD